MKGIWNKLLDMFTGWWWCVKHKHPSTCHSHLTQNCFWGHVALTMTILVICSFEATNSTRLWRYVMVLEWASPWTIHKLNCYIRFGTIFQDSLQQGHFCGIWNSVWLRSRKSSINKGMQRFTSISIPFCEKNVIYFAILFYYFNNFTRTGMKLRTHHFVTFQVFT